MRIKDLQSGDKFIFVKYAAIAVADPPTAAHPEDGTTLSILLKVDSSIMAIELSTGKDARIDHNFDENTRVIKLV